MMRPLANGFPLKYQGPMSILARVGDVLARLGATANAGAVGLAGLLRIMFASDPALRRRVAFSVAMIALSAKMAKADGIVTQDEVRAFQQIFSIPTAEARNVARLYELAQADVAGFETYAAQMAALCGSGKRDCAMLEDILDGLFHIAKADGLLHEREGLYLRRVAEIFEIGDDHYETILARHVDLGRADPYVILGIARGLPFEEVRRRYRELVSDNHPDRLIARGVPAEFIAIATARLAAINTAYEAIERALRPVA